MDAKQLSLALTAPFPPDAVHWKPLSVKGNKAMAAAYLDARAIMQRLDSVFGIGAWRDAYQLVNGGSVVCTLSVKVDGEWIDKTDVGSPSEQPDDGDKLKAAFSDSLKRAAIKLGIGRYLYRLPRQWVDYDPQARRFTRPPQLPAWALPATKQKRLTTAQRRGFFIAEAGRFCKNDSDGRAGQPHSVRQRLVTPAGVGGRPRHLECRQ